MFKHFLNYTWPDLSEDKKDPFQKRFSRGDSPTRITDKQARRNKRIRKAKAARKAKRITRMK